MTKPYLEHSLKDWERRAEALGLNLDGLYRGYQGADTDRDKPAEPGTDQRVSMKHNEGKVRLHLVPPRFIVEVAKVREFGSQKYATWDWALGRNWTDYHDAVQRHMLAWLAGEDCDPESGLSHLAHAATSLAFLIEFRATGAGCDNRPKGMIDNPMGENG